MGNKASRPARKLANTVTKTSPVTRSSQAHLPSQELKDKYGNSAKEAEQHSTSNKDTTGDKVPEQTSPRDSVPSGKDGMDPTADQAFINSINRLGRQIHSHTSRNPAEQLDVTALKQLLNRKSLYEKGQKEVKAQLDLESDSRSMIHPRTLTAILNALEHKALTEEIMKDYLVEKSFLENLGRFKVANNVVIIEEDRKDDEIGPKIGLPTAKAATQASMIDYDGDMTESVDTERIKKLRSRLE